MTAHFKFLSALLLLAVTLSTCRSIDEMLPYDTPNWSILETRRSKTPYDTYTVSFVGESGAIVPLSLFVMHGTKATQPADPFKWGYAFVWWYTSATDKTPATRFDFNTPITGDIKLYAKFVDAATYTMTGNTLIHIRGAVGDVEVPSSVNGTQVNAVGNGGGVLTLDGEQERSVTKLFLPNSVKVVGDDAFFNCTALASVSMPAVHTLGASSFHGCTALTSVSMPAVSTLGAGSFHGCTALTSVNMPSAITIRESAFSNCPALATVSMPVATTIGNFAFNYCPSLTSADMPNVSTVGKGAFMDCSTLVSVSMPLAATIGEYAFYSCYALTSVAMSSVTRLANYAFCNCNALPSIVLPNTIASIGDGAFKDCTSLALVKIYSLRTPNMAIPALGKDIFKNTASTLSILVPSFLVMRYQSAAAMLPYWRRIGRLT